MTGIFIKGEIVYSQGTVFAITFLLTAVVFFTIGFEVFRWASLGTYVFTIPGFLLMFVGVAALIELIYYGVKFMKMSG